MPKLLHAFRLAVLALLAAAPIAVRGAPIFVASGPPVHHPAVLFLNGSSWVGQVVDPQVKRILNASGWEVGAENLDALQWEDLQQYNVLVIHHLPPDVARSGGPRGSVLFARKLPVIQQFLQQGGGVLLLHDDAGDVTVPDMLLKPLGAELLDEEVTDPDHEWRQQDYLQYYFAWTDQVLPSPITSGVKTVWYPLGWSPRDDRKTVSFQVDSNWQVVVHGEPSAGTYRPGAGAAPASRTYSGSAPLAAIRNVGDGRFVLFPSSSSFTLEAGFHPIWQQIVWSQGNSTRRSDTGRLLLNALDWLAAPSLASGNLGGYVQPPVQPDRPDPDPPYHRGTEPAYEKQQFPGLIGIHSAYSDGTGSVEEYARAAKAAGYRFIAFTEHLPQMTEAKWKKETEDCAAVSDAGFLAMAGLCYEDTTGNRYCAFALPLWPKPEWLTPDGAKIKDTPGFYFGENWPPLALLDVSHNPEPPGVLKFFGAFSLYTCHAGTPATGGAQQAGQPWIDEARASYLAQMGNQYNSVPVAVHEIDSPSQVATQHGYQVIAWASHLDDVPKSLHHAWYAQPQGAYVSSGPRITGWWIENGASDNGTPGHEDLPWRLHLAVSSDVPLSEVRLMDGSRVYRRWNALDASFYRVVNGLHDKQHYFVLVVTDSRGCQAISPTLRTAVSRHSIYMCTDMQNTISCEVTRDRKGHWLFTDVETYNTGWDNLNPGILVPPAELMPDGLDYIAGGFGGGMGPTVRTTAGSENAVATQNLKFASGDALVMDHDYNLVIGPHGEVPTTIQRTHADTVEFTMPIYSCNLQVIRRETTFLQDVTLAHGPFPQIQTLGISAGAGAFKKYALTLPDGSVSTGERSDTAAQQPRRVTVPQGGYLAFYPNFYGSVAVFPLDSDMDASINKDGCVFGYDLPDQVIPKGTLQVQEFLLMRGAFGDNSPQSFDRIRKLYGLDGPPAYTIGAGLGQVTGHQFILRVQSEAGGARLLLGRANLPSDLPIRVDGLHDTWTTILMDEESGNWRPIGTNGGSAYAGLNLNRGDRRVFLGHPFECSSGKLFLQLSRQQGRLVLEVHNPLDHAVTATVRSNPHCPGLPGWLRKLDVPAGTSLDLIPDPGWLTAGKWLED